uniref:FBA_2 domain-containing protein n=1 Tax=Caenorhabditis tropicalis TaxID=1561998 RepID=A0A1I7UP53_9PELO
MVPSLDRMWAIDEKVTAMNSLRGAVTHFLWGVHTGLPDCGACRLPFVDPTPHRLLDILQPLSQDMLSDCIHIFTYDFYQVIVVDNHNAGLTVAEIQEASLFLGNQKYRRMKRITTARNNTFAIVVRQGIIKGWSQNGSFLIGRSTRNGFFLEFGPGTTEQQLEF